MNCKLRALNGISRKICSAELRPSVVLLFSLGVLCNVLGIRYSWPAALCVVELDDVDMAVCAPRSLEAQVTPALPDWSAVYTYLSGVDIGMHSAEKGLQTFHAWKDREEETNTSLWLGTRRPYLSNATAEDKIEDDVIDTILSSSYISLPENAMNGFSSVMETIVTWLLTPQHGIPY